MSGQIVFDEINIFYLYSSVKAEKLYMYIKKIHFKSIAEEFD